MEDLLRRIQLTIIEGPSTILDGLEKIRLQFTKVTTNIAPLSQNEFTKVTTNIAPLSQNICYFTTFAYTSHAKFSSYDLFSFFVVFRLHRI